MEVIWIRKILARNLLTVLGDHRELSQPRPPYCRRKRKGKEARKKKERERDLVTTLMLLS